MPRAIEPGGVVVNVRLGNYVASHSNDPQERIQFNQQIGMLSSSLEHAIPEQMFVTPENPGEAISAVKAIAKAQQSGQRIYHITQANMATALPNIHHSELVMQEIRDALATGKEVITHTDAVSVPGWEGAGYIITDPETGIGAYKISGGENGGFAALLSGVGLGAAAAAMIIALLASVSLGIMGFIAMLLLTLVMGTILMVVLAYNYTIFNSDSASACLDVGIGIGAFLSAIISGAMGPLREIFAAILGTVVPALMTRQSEVPAECLP